MAVEALAAAPSGGGVEVSMRIERGLLPELVAMPHDQALRYCRERIEECSRAIDIAEGRVQPEPPRVVLAQRIPLFPRGRA